MECQTLLIIVSSLLWRVQILSPRSGPVHPSLGWWNCPTSEGWGQTFKVQPVSLHCGGAGPSLCPWEESKPKVMLARKAEVAPPNCSFHRPSQNPMIQGRIPYFCMDYEFPQALVLWLFLPDIPRSWVTQRYKPEPNDGRAHHHISVEGILVWILSFCVYSGFTVAMQRYAVLDLA